MTAGSSTLHNGEEEFVSIAETLRRLPIGRTKISEILLKGEIASVKVGSRRLVSLASLRAYIRAALDANAKEIVNS